MMDTDQASCNGPERSFQVIDGEYRPRQSKIVIGRVVDILKDDYTIIYVANCISKDEVAQKVQEYQPDMLFSATMWTSEDAAEIEHAARFIRSDIKFYAIPFGLQVEKGPDAVVKHLLEQIPRLLG
ncbi:hypothetical protein DM02DRAFT_722176 [Periconia macrospinosa]|uniref:Heterokaryon incompatibility domain-containing protein n=1 Tax=Periconia macrospinosa TaxID=97972 RepID=A0A2V1D3U0_9PLEO|nr:hypothetical protein DM02DRAFT_722176 [Periconia macrospinosa]